MIKNSLVTLLVACSFASSAFATSIIDRLIIKHSQESFPISTTNQTTNYSNKPYTDFSGTWIPNCGDGPESPTVIENDANYFTMGHGMPVRIDQGLGGRYESNLKGTKYEHSSNEWNADRSALIMRNVILAKDNKNNSTLDTVVSKFVFT